MDSLLPNPPGVTDPSADRSSELIGWSVAMFVLSGIAVPMRFLSLWLIRSRRSGFNLSDWLALVALPFAWSLDIIVIYGTVHNNYGKHIGSSTLEQLQNYLMGLWIFELLYCWAITLAKLSLVALWWRIFKHSTGSYIALIVIGAVSIIWLVGASLTIVFSCVPVSGFWIITQQSQCLKRTSTWIGASVPNIAIDLVLLVLPNFWIRKLNVTRSQRIGLVCIFTLGLFVTISSALRLWQLIIADQQSAIDPQFATVATGIWSVVETNLALVCACLPTMRPLLRLMMTGRAKSSCDYSRGRSATPGQWDDRNRITDVKVHRPWSYEEPDEKPQVSQPAPRRLVAKQEPSMVLKPLPRVKSKLSTRELPSRSSQVLAPYREAYTSPLQPTFSTTIYAGQSPAPRATTSTHSGIWSSFRPPSSWSHAGEHSWLRLGDSRPVSTFVATPHRSSFDAGSVPTTPALPSMHSRAASRPASELDLDDFDFHYYHES